MIHLNINTFNSIFYDKFVKRFWYGNRLENVYCSQGWNINLIRKWYMKVTRYYCSSNFFLIFSWFSMNRMN